MIHIVLRIPLSLETLLTLYLERNLFAPTSPRPITHENVPDP